MATCDGCGNGTTKGNHPECERELRAAYEATFGVSSRTGAPLKGYEHPAENGRFGMDAEIGCLSNET